MVKLRRILVILFSFGALGAFALGLQHAVRSELFVFHSIEIESSRSVPPYDNETLIQLAQVPIGKVSLFDLDMGAIEKRLMALPWINSVKLQKKVPDTLVIAVNYRQPRAIVQGLKGVLAYSDLEGNVFGSMNLMTIEDLPFLSGFVTFAPFTPVVPFPRKEDVSTGRVLINSERLKEALLFLAAWQDSGLNRLSQISSIQWEVGRGFKAWVMYSIGERNLTQSSNRNNQVRVLVDLGQNIDQYPQGKLVQLAKVFQHLSGNSIAARQVWADAGKKIVVKTERGS